MDRLPSRHEMKMSRFRQNKIRDHAMAAYLVKQGRQGRSAGPIFLRSFP